MVSFNLFLEQIDKNGLISYDNFNIIFYKTLMFLMGSKLTDLRRDKIAENVF